MTDPRARAPERDTLQCPCHMACGIAGYPITINFLPGDEKLIVIPPAPGPGRYRPALRGRSPARVKYIAQRA